MKGPDRFSPTADQATEKNAKVMGKGVSTHTVKNITEKLSGRRAGYPSPSEYVQVLLKWGQAHTRRTIVAID